jgi:predicted ATPase
LLLLDDLHWADASSLKLFAYLGRRIDHSCILLVGAYRPEELSGEEEEQQQTLTLVSHELQRYFGTIHLNLDQVSASERRQFVAEWLDTQPNRLDNAFRQALFQLTEGHALFTTELVHYLQERGDLHRDDSGRWRERAELDCNTPGPSAHRFTPRVAHRQRRRRRIHRRGD